MMMVPRGPTKQITALLVLAVVIAVRGDAHLLDAYLQATQITVESDSVRWN